MYARYVESAALAVRHFNGIYRVLVRAGEIKPRKTRPHRKPVYYQMNYPGQRVQVDAKYMPVIFNSSHPEGYQEYQYPAIDDCIRLCLIKTYEELCPASSVDFARRVLEFFPFPHRGDTNRPWNGVHLYLHAPC